MAAAPAKDTGPPERVLALDALRGWAVAGILVMNVLFFTMPSAAYFNPRAYGGIDPANLSLWTATFLLIEDKMRGLFAMLFGASMTLMLGRASLAEHYRRMLWLLIIGFVHAILLANNDILRLYALCGLLLPLFARLSVRGLWLAAFASLAIHMMLGGYIAWAWIDHYYVAAADPEVDRRQLAFAERAFGADSAVSAAAIAMARGDYGAVLAGRLAFYTHPAGVAIAALALMPVTLATMLSGMAMFKSGLFGGSWPQARMRRWTISGFAIGLPPLIAMALWDFDSGFAAVIVAANALVWSAPFDLAMSIGWAALLIGWFMRRPDSGWVRRLAATGRMALTNYLGSSVILATLGFGFGFGLFGQVSRSSALLLALLPIAVMLTVSPPWLARHAQGPAEWVWRSLTRLRIEPWRKPTA